HVIEGRDPIRRHHQELVAAQLVGVPHLAACEELERELGVGQGRSGDHEVGTPKPRRSYARSVCSRPAHGSKTSSIFEPMRFTTSSLFSSKVRNPVPELSIACMAAF